MSVFAVGLTGGIASGKSTVARWLADAGYRMVDADEVVAELYAPGGRGAEAVRELLGAEMLADDGSVDHAAVAERVFDDSAARARLEAAVHPLVRERFGEIAREAGGVVVLEATLLVEAGYAPDFDLVVTVEADAEARLDRAIARGLVRDQVKARMVAQGDGEERRAAAHRVIRNDGSLGELRAEIDGLIEEIERARGAG